MRQTISPSISHFFNHAFRQLFQIILTITALSHLSFNWCVILTLNVSALYFFTNKYNISLRALNITPVSLGLFETEFSSALHTKWQQISREEQCLGLIRIARESAFKIQLNLNAVDFIIYANLSTTHVCFKEYLTFIAFTNFSCFIKAIVIILSNFSLKSSKS